MTNSARLCFGAQGMGDNDPQCTGPDVRDCTFIPPSPFGHTPTVGWQVTPWCMYCRITAKDAGYQVYTWTHHVGECSCGKRFRISQESLDEARAREPLLTDAEIIDTFDLCLSCAIGEEITGEEVTGGRAPASANIEHDGSDPNCPQCRAAANDPNDDLWRIPGLTPRDIFAIYAALEVACDDEDEPYPGLRDALEKVTAVRDAVRRAGFKAHTETSAQSQAYIDGAGPWFGRDDEEQDGVITYECRFCKQTVTATEQDIIDAHDCEDADSEDGPREDLSDAEAMREHGRDICPNCTGEKRD